MSIKFTQPFTIRSLLSTARKMLSASPNNTVSRTPSLDANCLLSHILGITLSKLRSYDTEIVPDEQVFLFEAAIEKRLSGLPVAYITGQKEFFGYNFHVTPDVLIPKPDTELLTEYAINAIKQSFSHNDETPFNNSSAAGSKFVVGSNFVAADICTGSGCIAISILKSLSEIHDFPFEKISIIASDISKPALDIAELNADNLLSKPIRDKISFLCTDLLSGIKSESLDLILSNPPYVPSSITSQLLADGRSEPRLALDGDAFDKSNSSDGMSIIKRLIPQAFDKLKKNGTFMIETGEYNAEKTMDLLKQTGFDGVSNYRDLAGEMRLTCAKKL